MNKSWHRAFGVYGLYRKDHKLLVIKKSRGPYKNRYDLPGGSPEKGGSHSETLNREFTEETGLEVLGKTLIGMVDFQLPWVWREYSHVHHTAVFYQVNKADGEIEEPDQFDGQDSLGTYWLTENEANEDNASPLVIEAFKWFALATISTEPVIYEKWRVVEKTEEAPWNQND
ncbi:NUDIX hydrolase [Jeotgalibacillus malaysiensis]|uniref:NUDIX hydrolase n=1 Tax=Jeotgalibacillus malaysiensis TaxID=1508404 RepID=UPI00384E9064